MKHIWIVAAAALLAACSPMQGPGAGMGGAGGSAHGMAAMGNKDSMCAGHMKMMQEMQQKMAGAKTPEERSAMMQEHMKSMQGGMGMHGGMTACRMDMMDMKMTMMMQMMMDRDPARQPATR